MPRERPSADWRPTLAAVLRLTEPGTFSLENDRWGHWSAAACLRDSGDRGPLVHFGAHTIGASLRSLLRDLQKRKAGA
jgi:hypothetical protein